MKSEEAKQLKSKAIKILGDYKTKDAIAWLADKYPRSLKSINATAPTKDKDGKPIEKGLCFSDGNHKYELLCLEASTTYFPDGESLRGGNFKFYYDDQLVLATTYSINQNEWTSELEINWYDFSIEVLKLSDWVENLPTLVEEEKAALETAEAKTLKEQEKAEAQNIQKNVDLGKYG